MVSRIDTNVYNYTIIFQNSYLNEKSVLSSFTLHYSNITNLTRYTLLPYSKLSENLSKTNTAAVQKKPAHPSANLDTCVHFRKPESRPSLLYI